jgi:hypothetical protein
MQQNVTSQDMSSKTSFDVLGKSLHRLIKIFCNKRQALNKNNKKQSIFTEEKS